MNDTKTFTQKLALRAVLPVALLSTTLACSDSGGAEPGPAGSVNEALVNIGAWESYSPPLPDKDEPTGKAPETTTEPLAGDTYACTATEYEITQNPREFTMYSPNASVMWLGNLVQGQSHVLGSLQEVSIRQRAPLAITIDFLNADAPAIVDNPSQTTVSSAIGGLIQDAHDNGHRAGSTATFDSRLTHSVQQSALSLGLSGRYLGASASASLDVQRNASQRTLTAHFVQKMFTASIELPQRPADVFSADITPEILAAAGVGPNNPPLYIANIVYGRMLTYSLTSTHSEERMRAAISASFNGLAGGASGYTEVQLRETLSEENTRIQVVGGNAGAAIEAITGGTLSDYFSVEALQGGGTRTTR